MPKAQPLTTTRSPPGRPASGPSWWGGLANADAKALKVGGVYSVGFAVHDDNITSLGHQVSFFKTLGLGAKKKTDIEAVKLH